MLDNSEVTEGEGTSQRALEPVWCVAANIVQERLAAGPFGLEKRRGTKHFVGGAKVYVAGFYWGTGGENVVVIGRHRGSPIYITLAMPARMLTNWRAVLVYKPLILNKIEECKRDSGGYWADWDGSGESRNRAKEIVEQYNEICRKNPNQADSSPIPLRDVSRMYIWGVIAEVTEAAAQSNIDPDDPICNFEPGTRVYIIQFPDMDAERVEIAARRSDNAQYMTAIVDSRWLGNWQASRINSGFAITRMLGEPEEVAGDK